METLRVKDLVKILKMAGLDKKVFLASDTEGNRFGTIQRVSVKVDGDKVLIYPYNEGMEYPDLR